MKRLKNIKKIKHTLLNRKGNEVVLGECVVRNINIQYNKIVEKYLDSGLFEINGNTLHIYSERNHSIKRSDFIFFMLEENCLQCFDVDECTAYRGLTLFTFELHCLDSWARYYLCEIKTRNPRSLKDYFMAANELRNFYFKLKYLHASYSEEKYFYIDNKFISGIYSYDPTNENKRAFKKEVIKYKMTRMQ